MLRLPDARTGHYAEVRPARPGLLRVSAHLRPGAGEPDWTGVRVLLIADLLARAGELRGLQVLTAAVFPGEPPAEQGYAERAAGLLGILPAAVRASTPEVRTVLGGSADVHIAGPDSESDGMRGLVTRAGAVRVRTAGSGEGGPPDAGEIPAAADPLAIRLALMSHPHDHPADLDDGVLAEASKRAAQWRGQVADWAESPSKPMPPRVRAALDAALDDLDMPRALHLLTGFAHDADVPDGARFEIFAYADRVLGLELAREIGQPRR